MDRHPLLNELIEECKKHDVDLSKAFITYEVYQELSEVRKFSNLQYSFNAQLQLFYLSGKQEPTDTQPSIFIPVPSNYEITPQEISLLQETLSPDNKRVYLFIRDNDSSSTCYCLTEGLVPPDSPDACKEKKMVEGRKYQFYKNLQNNRKVIYTEALRKSKT